MEGFENIPLPKLPGTEFYSPLDLARPRPQVFKVVNGIAGNYGEVSVQKDKNFLFLSFSALPTCTDAFFRFLFSIP